MSMVSIPRAEKTPGVGGMMTRDMDMSRRARRKIPPAPPYDMSVNRGVVSLTDEYLLGGCGHVVPRYRKMSAVSLGPDQLAMR
jgi:hypothetical protein